ncbi:septum formation initiator family protein [Pseudoflavitalea sp. G-6-1-2]|uniref:FtsB family cell division protein n=1 Tax=Pseudoflavitalea sp. G-6-1-2 TaxID=2728841 RepID=UPI00146BDD03|nr:septum formation initiator family protein [Pseudoflavitalea sp. G-6-1-2]NML19666.1 septum formation initiator family protein [Pseudoflavitalea sp. G-6-1-2]
MKLLSRIPAWLKNKYTITTIVFVVWLLFFDDQDIFTTWFRHKKELHKLEESRDYYLDQIKLTKSELDQLKSDKTTLEKYAREKYWMKKDNEDLFILPE